MPEILDVKLPNFAFIAGQSDHFLENPWRLEFALGQLEMDLLPGRGRHLGQVGESFLVPPSKCHEGNLHFIETIQIGIGGKLGVENQVLRLFAGSRLPIFHECQDLEHPTILDKRTTKIDRRRAPKFRWNARLCLFHYTQQ